MDVSSDISAEHWFEVRESEIAPHILVRRR